MSIPPDVLVELNPAVELDEGKVVVELRSPAELVVPDDLLDAVLGLLARARPRGPVVLAEHHLDVAGALPQQAVRCSQNVPAVTPTMNLLHAWLRGLREVEMFTRKIFFYLRH